MNKKSPYQKPVTRIKNDVDDEIIILIIKIIVSYFIEGIMQQYLIMLMNNNCITLHRGNYASTFDHTNDKK